MSDEKYKQEARYSWQEIASIAESVPESASYIHGFIDGMKIGNKELEHEIERLNRFCKEFIYGEDNPKYYKTMDEKIAEKEARILELEGKLKASEKTGLYISKCALEGVAELEKLEKQNVRMKECLELTFKDINECGFIAIMELRIKQCLKELEGEE